MKMSAYPLPVTGYPNLATTQLLMSAAGGLVLPTPPGAGSPKDIPSVSGTAIAGLGGRVPGLPELPTSGPVHNYLPAAQFAAMAGMSDPRLLYSALSGGYDMKDNAETLMAWRHIAAQAQAASTGMLPYDTHAAAMAAASFPYAGYPGMDLNGARRKNATRETTNTLKAWLYEHRKNPYPTKGEKIMLAIITKMTLTQVSTWFANARRRLKKENKMTWSPRNRTDEGSDDGEDKGDDDEGGDDDVSIDLSDFESEASPHKIVTSTSTSTANAEPLSSQPSEPLATNKDSSRPRIWSIADVAASKPASASSTPIHHQSASVRHRPYPMPGSSVPGSTAAFRPWFDSSYRQLAGHNIMNNPLLQNRPTTSPASLRVPISTTPTQPSISRSPVTTPSSNEKSASLTENKEDVRESPSPK